MRGQHCEKDVGTKVAAFSQHLESTNPNQESPNLTTENVELLTKFATFLQQQKHEKHMHSHDHHGHWHGKHGKFGKHGHHAMFGHHFGKHGPYGKHHHGHHGHHGHGHGKHGKHGFECGKHFEHGHHFGKHIVKHIVYSKVTPGETIVIEEGELVGTGRNPSPPLQVNTTGAQVAEGSSELYNAIRVRERNDRHSGRRLRAREWVIIPKPTEETTQGPSQAERNEPLQDNLATMVENITIESSSKE